MPAAVPSALAACRRFGHRFGRAAAPVIRRGLATALRLSDAGLRALGRGARRHRRPLRALGERLAWWSALGLLVLGGRPVLGEGPVPEPWLALAPFVAGLLLCALLRLTSSARQLRMAALWLGALHGTAAALVWTAFAG
ncbi:hypothetical protein [Paraliomyxa miuraensis]|uniref:hypothetical protein n=1 Tax=Paraliomyxa miuraensis TaxID=376150 RepID=UPI002250F49E|nr:hypothetical protein [Paraliomyxa miuraensis]MCX4245284.1 hypothetical protein [Paraliomyxa miuraensis]